MKTTKTNMPDWSALIPVLPGGGKRQAALYAEIRRMIESGRLAPGAKLPTTRELAERLGVARGAAVAAYEMLVADGFAEARVGAGTFVAARVPRLERGPAMRPAAVTDEPTVLPGSLGVGMDDARTADTLRRLFARRLARPSLIDRSYGDPRGTAALRSEIAVYLGAARGVKCTADEVIVTAGSQQGLDLVVRAVLAPGDPVWIEDPCYPMALAAFRGAGLRVTGVPVDGEGLSVAAGEARQPRARAVYVTPSHQFPLGVAMTMARRLALIDWAKRVGAWIFEDDYDSEFRHAGAPLASLQGIDDGGRVVYLGTFSKALTPSLRVGYVVAPPALADAIVEVKARTDRFAPRLIEDVLAALMAEGHFAAHIRRARRRAREARDALVEGLAATRLAVTVPDQGLHLIADLPDGLSDVALLPALRAAGLAARALSACFVEAPGRQGLVIGFSGFAPDVLAATARGIAPVIERAMEDAARSSHRRVAGE